MQRKLRYMECSLLNTKQNARPLHRANSSHFACSVQEVHKLNKQCTKMKLMEHTSSY